jgi:hypothetical protein
VSGHALEGEIAARLPVLAGRAPATPATAAVNVDVYGAAQALSVAPGEVLILAFADLSPHDRRGLEAIRDRLRDTGLRDNQYVIIAGRVELTKIALETDTGTVNAEWTQ